ncbi:hypothetical protein Tco_0107101 [Tanacetum coccineum]
MIIKKDSKKHKKEIVKAKVERKSIALKAKKESSDEECSTFGSEDEERSKEAVMTRTVKVIENALENATRKTRTKGLLSEAPGAIVVKKMMKRSKMKRVS